MPNIKSLLNSNPRDTDVTLVIKDPLKTYTTGDTIYGHVVLEVADKHLSPTEAFVGLKCVETCKLEGVEEKQFIHYNQSLSIITSLTSANNELGCSHGRHVLPFEFLLSNETFRLPFTVELDDIGAPEIGIRWIMTVNINVEIRDGYFKKTRNLEDSQRLCVHPKFSPEEPDYTNTRSVKKNCNLFTIIMEKMPLYLPRSPELFSIDVIVESEGPVFVQSVSAYLIKKALFTSCESEYWPSKESKTLLDKQSVGRMLAGKVHLDGFLRNCNIDSFQVPDLFSLYLVVTPILEIIIEGPVFESAHFRVDISPPWYSRLEGRH